jgi:hypothetical protein
MIASRTRDLRKITTSILNLLAKGTVGAGSHLLLAENMLPVRSFNMRGERSMTYAERIAAYQPEQSMAGRGTQARPCRRASSIAFK